MQKTLLITLISFSILTTNAQSIQGHKYVNKEAKVSFEVDSSWTLDTLEKPITAVRMARGEMITFHLQRMNDNVDDFFKNMGEKDILSFRESIIKKYESGGETVKKMEVKKGIFLNSYCLISIAHVEGQPYLDGIPVLKKQINFSIGKNYLAAFIYFLPEKIATQKEIGSIEKQILTFKKL